MAPSILVVDDCPHMITLLTLAFGGRSYEVTSAGSAEEALDRLGARVPDVIVTDYSMPGMDGAQLCEVIRANPSSLRVPIVLFSSAEPNQSMLRALALDDVHYRVKTAGIHTILELVAQLVRAVAMPAAAMPVTGAPLPWRRATAAT